MSSDYPGTITKLLAEFKGSNTEAKEKSLAAIWATYFERLSQVANRVLTSKARKAGDDPIDVVDSVFGKIMENVRSGVPFTPADRGSLWGLLLHSTRCKSIDYNRRAGRKKNGGDYTETELVDEIVSHEPSPDDVASIKDDIGRGLDLLETTAESQKLRLREIASLGLQGKSVQEISAFLNISERTIQRRLLMIYSAWETEFESAT